MLCNDTGNKYVALILHIEFRWLSRAKVLLTVFQLNEELSIFLSEIEIPLASYFSDVSWLQQLACLGDIFNKLKESACQWSATTKPHLG